MAEPVRAGRLRGAGAALLVQHPVSRHRGGHGALRAGAGGALRVVSLRT